MTMLTPEEKLRRLKEAYEGLDPMQQCVIDAFYQSITPAQSIRFLDCYSFVNHANPTRDKGLINRVFKLATQLILLS